jgi:hypothetical protein
MNGDTIEASPWSTRRWALVAAVLFAMQAGAVWLFSARTTEAPRQPQAQFVARWFTSPNAARAVDQLLLNDPTHLAAVNPKGFSGAAWLRPTPPAYQPAEWRETERSLVQPTQALGSAFGQVARTSPAMVFDPSRKAAAAPLTTAVAQPPLRSVSRLLVEGPLRSRALIESPPIPSRSHHDVLADTRVQVSVSAEGLVLPPRLLPANGVKDPAQRAAQRAADQHALELARALRFAPAPKSAEARAATPSEGILVFQWHTVAPPAPKQE